VSARARIPQAGAIVFRMEDDRPLVLLVRSKKNPEIWVFPKGHIDAGESAEATAARETWEEAGVEGDLGDAVGAPLEFESNGESVSVQYFVLIARREEPSPEGRDKRWLSIDEALATLAYDTSREKLHEAVERLQRASRAASPRR
jgi:8-oxo-dGTP pyrophosphatase MutT (NUDIX family)